MYLLFIYYLYLLCIYYLFIIYILSIYYLLIIYILSIYYLFIYCFRQARDRDSGNFSMVRYLLQDSSSVSEAFRIDPLSGDIYTASASQFFEDAGSHFDLSVIAYDNFGRDKSLSGSTTVTVSCGKEFLGCLFVLRR